MFDIASMKSPKILLSVKDLLNTEIICGIGPEIQQFAHFRVSMEDRVEEVLCTLEKLQPIEVFPAGKFSWCPSVE